MKMQIDEAVKVLEEVVPLEGTEVGEMWQHLVDLWQSYRDYVSDAMYEMLEREIIREAITIRKDFEIREVKYPSNEYIRKELVEKKK